MSDTQVDAEIKDVPSPDIDNYKKEIETLKRTSDGLFADLQKFKEKSRQYDQLMADQQKTVDESKSHKERYESLQKQYDDDKTSWQKQKDSYDSEKLYLKALKIANELGPVNADAAELLAEQIQKRLKMTEDGIAILDKDGKVSNNKDKELIEELKSLERYKIFLRGRDSAGSGAKAGGQSGGTGRGDSNLNKLPPVERIVELRKREAEGR